MNWVKIVKDFWAAVWRARGTYMDAIDRLVVDDFVKNEDGSRVALTGHGQYNRILRIPADQRPIDFTASRSGPSARRETAAQLGLNAVRGSWSSA